MGNCLVTKLKGVVDNNNLDYLGFGTVRVDSDIYGRIMIGTFTAGEIKWGNELAVFADDAHTQPLTSPVTTVAEQRINLYYTGRGKIFISKYNAMDVSYVDCSNLLSFAAAPCMQLRYFEGLFGNLSDFAAYMKKKPTVISAFFQRFKGSGDIWYDINGDLSVFADMNYPATTNLVFGYGSDWSGARISGDPTYFSAFPNLTTLNVNLCRLLSSYRIKPLLDAMFAKGRTSGTLTINASGLGWYYNEGEGHNNFTVTFTSEGYTVTGFD